MVVEQTHPCIQETSIALINNNVSYMNKKQDEILATLNKFIDTAEKKFATKDELEQINKKVEETRKSINWFVITILTIIL